VIELNVDCGLKNFNEAGVQGNNKGLRSIRLKLARMAQIADHHDVITRLWLGLDLKVSNIRSAISPVHTLLCNFTATVGLLATFTLLSIFQCIT